jgi:TonB family protein
MKEGIVVIAPPPPPPIVYENNKFQAPPPPPPPANDQKEVFFVVEEMPEYPGGFQALGEYIREMQNKFSQSNNLSGKSKVAFTVSETGKVINVKIVEQDNVEVGKAAATIVMNMKDWAPGKQRGKPVPVNYLLPVTFN